MPGLISYLFGLAGASGYGSRTTAEQVARDNADRIKGKTFVVTGCTSGIGKESALRLAEQGGRVVMACRNKEKMAKAAEEIRRAVPGAVLHELILDLSSSDSLRKFGTDIKALKLGGVHCLINNAGVLACPLTYTNDGFEMQFGSNHLGHFLLTNILIDELKEGQPSRVVNVSSALHSMAYKPEGIRFDDLDGKKKYTEWGAYGQSKLANVLHAQELDRRFKEKGLNITAHSLHPGVINTDLARHLNGAFTTMLLNAATALFGKSIAQGAATTLYVATSPQLDNKGGLYYANCNEEPLNHTSLTTIPDLAKRLWDASAAMTKSDFK